MHTIITHQYVRLVMLLRSTHARIGGNRLFTAVSTQCRTLNKREEKNEYYNWYKLHDQMHLKYASNKYCFKSCVLNAPRRKHRAEESMNYESEIDVCLVFGFLMCFIVFSDDSKRKIRTFNWKPKCQPFKERNHHKQLLLMIALNGKCNIQWIPQWRIEMSKRLWLRSIEWKEATSKRTMFGICNKCNMHADILKRQLVCLHGKVDKLNMNWTRTTKLNMNNAFRS